MSDCLCHACIAEHDIRDPCGWPLPLTMMILCPICGNKRCPHASDHRLACTGSNEPGQPMSDENLRLSCDAQMFARANEVLRDENERLRNFARQVMQAWPHGDVDGGELQDAAIEFGLLQETRAHEPCGERCQCVEYFSSDEWDSGVTCYHPTPLLTGDGER